MPLWHLVVIFFNDAANVAVTNNNCDYSPQNAKEVDEKIIKKINFVYSSGIITLVAKDFFRLQIVKILNFKNSYPINNMQSFWKCITH